MDSKGGNMLEDKEPFEQGRTDSYYRRPPRGSVLYVNPREIAEYETGYDHNEACGEHKDFDEWDMEVTEDEG